MTTTMRVIIVAVAAEEHWAYSSGPLFLIAEKKTLGFLIAFFVEFASRCSLVGCLFKNIGNHKENLDSQD